MNHHISSNGWRVWQHAEPSRQQQHPQQIPSSQRFADLHEQVRQQQQLRQQLQQHHRLQQRQQQLQWQQQVVQQQRQQQERQQHRVSPRRSFLLRGEEQQLQQIFKTSLHLQASPTCSAPSGVPGSAVLSLNQGKGFPQQQRQPHLVAPAADALSVLYGSVAVARNKGALSPPYAFGAGAASSWQQEQPSLSCSTSANTTSSTVYPCSVSASRGSVWLREVGMRGQPATCMYSCSGAARSTVGGISAIRASASAEAAPSAALTFTVRTTAVPAGGREEVLHKPEGASSAAAHLPVSSVGSRAKTPPAALPGGDVTAAEAAPPPAAASATQNEEARAAAIGCTATAAQGAAACGAAGAAVNEGEDAAGCSKDRVAPQISGARAAPAPASAVAALTTHLLVPDGTSKRLNNMGDAQRVDQAAADNSHRILTDRRIGAQGTITVARADGASPAVLSGAASGEARTGFQMSSSLPERGVGPAYSPCQTPSSMCATPPSPSAAVAAPLRTFAVAAAHGTAQPTWDTASSMKLPPRMLTADSPRTAAAATDAGARAAASTALRTRAAPTGGVQATALQPRLPLQECGKGLKAPDMQSRLTVQALQRPARYALQQQVQQQRTKRGPLLPSTAAGRVSRVIPLLQKEMARQEEQDRVTGEERSSKAKQPAEKDDNMRIFKKDSSIAASATDLSDEDGPAASRKVDETACEACCPQLWAVSPADLFSLNMTSACQGSTTALGDTAAAAAMQQERRRAAFGSALKLLRAAEDEARQLVQTAHERRAHRRSRVLVEVETAQQAYRVSREREWKVKQKTYEEETAALNAQMEKVVDMQLQADTEGLAERQYEAATFVTEKVMEVDISCPLEAVKRFASPRRQLAFYAARARQEQQVIHHPPGDRFRREKDVIIWDDRGYAKVEHLAADNKTTSVTQLGSFWVRHQSKAQQHSDRPLVLLSTQYLPGESFDADDEEIGETDGKKIEAKRIGQTSGFPPLRSLSEVRPPPVQSRSYKGDDSLLTMQKIQSRDDVEVERLPSKLRAELEYSAHHETSSKTKESK